MDRKRHLSIARQRQDGLELIVGLDHRVGHFRPRRILAKVAERLDLSTVGCFCVVQKQRGVADAMIEARKYLWYHNLIVQINLHFSS